MGHMRWPYAFKMRRGVKQLWKNAFRSWPWHHKIMRRALGSVSSHWMYGVFQRLIYTGLMFKHQMRIGIQDWWEPEMYPSSPDQPVNGGRHCTAQLSSKQAAYTGGASGKDPPGLLGWWVWVLYWVTPASNNWLLMWSRAPDQAELLYKIQPAWKMSIHNIKNAF